MQRIIDLNIRLLKINKIYIFYTYYTRAIDIYDLSLWVINPSKKPSESIKFGIQINIDNETYENKILHIAINLLRSWPRQRYFLVLIPDTFLPGMSASSRVFLT